MHKLVGVRTSVCTCVYVCLYVCVYICVISLVCTCVCMHVYIPHTHMLIETKQVVSAKSLIASFMELFNFYGYFLLALIGTMIM